MTLNSHNSKVRKKKFPFCLETNSTFYWNEKWLYISPFGSQVSCLSGRICDSSCMSVVFAWGDRHADLPGSSGRGTENFGGSCFCQPSPRLSSPNTFLIGTQRLILSDLPDLAGDQHSSLNLSPPVGFCDSTLSFLPLHYNFSVLTPLKW